MNIYEKLNKCRIELQTMNLKKSGQNKFAGYYYYELGDFLPVINELFNGNKLFSHVSFGTELATLTIVNTDKPEEMVVFESPMSSAALKGCHEVQNLGAVQTYLRRYLYTVALEIVEHDALDAVTGGNGFDPECEITADDIPDIKTEAEKIFSGKTDVVKSECEQCQAQMTQGQMTISKKEFDGRVLCRRCQKEAK